MVYLRKNHVRKGVTVAEFTIIDGPDVGTVEGEPMSRSDVGESGMIVGVPTEVKDNELRVGLSPGSAAELVGHGHVVVVQSGAGVGIGADDDAYERVGAKVVDTAVDVFDQADLLVKVKEPQPVERTWLRPELLRLKNAIDREIKVLDAIFAALVKMEGTRNPSSPFFPLIARSLLPPHLRSGGVP